VVSTATKLTYRLTRGGGDDETCKCAVVRDETVGIFASKAAEYTSPLTHK